MIIILHFNYVVIYLLSKIMKNKHSAVFFFFLPSVKIIKKKDINVKTKLTNKKVNGGDNNVEY